MNRAEVEAIVRRVLRSQIQSYLTPDSIPASAVRDDPEGGGGETLAADVTIADAAGDFTATNVEDALAEIQTDIEAHAASINQKLDKSGGDLTGQVRVVSDSSDGFGIKRSADTGVRAYLDEDGLYFGSGTGFTDWGIERTAADVATLQAGDDLRRTDDGSNANSLIRKAQLDALDASVDTALAGKSDTGHTHDDRYYTETEIDTALAGKSATGHGHTLADISDAGSAAGLDAPAVGDATAGQVVKGSDTRLTDARTPTTHTHDDRYYTETEVDAALAGKSDTTHNHDASYSPLGHTHDDRYYTEAEVDTALAGKSSTGHTHTLSDVTDAGTAASHNVPSVGDAAAGEVVKGDDSRLSDARIPVNHDHDSRYYTETEIDAALAGKLDKSGGTMTGDITLDDSEVLVETNGATFHGFGIKRVSDASARVYLDELGLYLGGGAAVPDWTLLRTAAGVAELGSGDDLRRTDDGANANSLVRKSQVDAALAGKSDTSHNHDATYSPLGHTHDDRYFTEAEVTTALAGKSDVGHNHDADYAPVVHTHDDRYYTEAEVDTLINGRASDAELAALQAEVDADEAALASHLADAAGAHPASAISVSDSDGNLDATEVEAALEEIHGKVSGGSLVQALELIGTTIRGMTPFGLATGNNWVMTSGEALIVPVPVKGGKEINGVRFGQGTGGSFTADNNNKIGLYTSDGTTLTKVAETANDATLFANSSNSQRSIDFVAGYTPPKDEVVWVVFLFNASAITTSPSISAINLLTTMNNIFTGYTNGSETLPMGWWNNSGTYPTDLPASTAWSNFSRWRTAPFALLYG